MRLLAVCESPPSTDAATGNGSTLIAAQLLSRLPSDFDLSLVYFSDHGRRLDDDVRQRADRIAALPIRSRRRSAAFSPFTRLPRATWQRTTRQAREVVAEHDADADVVLLHGVHTFGLLPELSSPVVAHEVDPWSDHWRQRSLTRRPPSAWYDRTQARRAERLERLVAARAHDLIVVSAADARRMSTRLRRPVRAIPNGVAFARRPTAPIERAERRSMAFIGSLDYPANVAAVRTLCEEIFPRIRREVPDAHLIVAGRRPDPSVLAATSAHRDIELLPDVPDMWAVLERAAFAVFPGDLGFGQKNTVLETLSAGRPVVASEGSARGHEPGDHLTVAASTEAFVSVAVRLLTDDEAWRAAADKATTHAALLPHWDDVSQTMVTILRDAARSAAADQRSN